MKLTPITFSHPEKQHSALEALHCYMCCLIMITLLSILSAWVFSLINSSAFISISAMRLLNSVVIIYLGAYLAHAKKLPLMLSLAALGLAGLLSFYINELLALVVIAGITMLKSRD